MSTRKRKHRIGNRELALLQILAVLLLLLFLFVRP